MSYKPRAVRPAVDRILDKVVDRVGCWIYTGSLNPSGYGQVNVGRRGEGRVMTHRATYEFFRAEIPEGLFLDHLCRNRACVNPWHLEPVTPKVNSERGDMAGNGEHHRSKTECVHGHPFTPENTLRTTQGHRQCRTCHNARALRRYHARKKAAA
jgi:hypothetical protein